MFTLLTQKIILTTLKLILEYKSSLQIDSSLRAHAVHNNSQDNTSFLEKNIQVSCF